MFLHCQRRDVVGCWCELRFLLGGGHKVGESPCGEVWQGVAEEVMTEVSSRGLVDSFFVGEKRQWGAGEGLLHWVGVLEVKTRCLERRSFQNGSYFFLSVVSV